MKINGNLTFLGGGVAENLRIEALTNDPASPLDQQFWVNTTDSKIRSKVGGNVITLADDAALQLIINEVGVVEGSVGLDVDGNLAAFTGANYIAGATTIRAAVVTLDGQAKTTADALAAETTRATGAEATELTRATAAEGVLTAAVNAEVTRATAAEGVLTAAVNAEVTRATGAEQTLTDNLAAEVTRATGAEAALDTRVTAIEGSYIKKDGSVAFTGDINANSNSLVNLADPVDAGDAVNKSYVDDKVSAIGAVFEYVGALEGGIDGAGATDLSLLAQKDAGDYYKVTTGGYFKLGVGAPFFANVNDGLIFNLAAGIDVIDNTNSQVQGSTNFVSVTGNSDTGFVVDIDAAFKSRVSTAETDILAEVTRATAAEGVVTAAVNAEVTRATAAEGVLTAAINAEVTRATAAEGVVTAAVATEQTRATAAEAALDTRVTAVQGELDAAEAAIGLSTAGAFVAVTGSNYLGSATTIVGLSQALDGAVKTLSDKVAASFFVYNGSTPATSHTVTHNIGSQYVNVTVVDSNDNVIIPQSVVFVSATVLTVTFNSSIACKVVVSGLAA